MNRPTWPAVLVNHTIRNDGTQTTSRRTMTTADAVTARDNWLARARRAGWPASLGSGLVALVPHPLDADGHGRLVMLVHIERFPDAQGGG